MYDLPMVENAPVTNDGSSRPPSKSQIAREAGGETLEMRQGHSIISNQGKLQRSVPKS